MSEYDKLVQLLLDLATSCTRNQRGGINGMSEVQRPDDAGTLL